MKNYKLTVLKGDGIGPEIVDEAIKALDTAADKFGFSVQYDYKLLGAVPSGTASPGGTGPRPGFWEYARPWGSMPI